MLLEGVCYFFILIIWGRREGIEFLRQEEYIDSIMQFFFSENVRT